MTHRLATNNKVWFFIALLLTAFFSLAVPSKADPYTNASTAQIEQQSAFVRSDTFVVDVGAVAAEDLWDSAPARFDATVLPQIRYVTVKHCDETDTALNLCVRWGPATDTPAMSCVLTEAGGADSGDPMTAFGDYRAMHVQRLTGGVTPSPVPIPIWARAESGTVSVCVTVHF
jgi:hypothetical protein